MTPADMLKAAEELPIVDLVALVKDLVDLVGNKGGRQQEVAAARAAGELAVDALERAETGGG